MISGISNRWRHCDAVRAGGVLQQQRDALAGLLEVDAVVDTVEVEVDVAADGAVEPAGATAGDGPGRVRQRRRPAARSSSITRAIAGKYCQ